MNSETTMYDQKRKNDESAKDNDTNNGDKKINKRSNKFEKLIDPENEDHLDFEDPFEDILEEEEVINDESDHETDTIVNIEEKEEETKEKDSTPKEVWRAGIDKMQEDEVLDYDSSAYDMYLALNAEWPSLSIDIVNDTLGNCRTKFPMTMYAVAGSQATEKKDNKVTIMKLSQLYQTNKKKNENQSEIESDDDSIDDEDLEPILESKTFSHYGGINRIRTMATAPSDTNKNCTIVSTWASTGKVHLWDITKQIQSFDDKPTIGNSTNIQLSPITTFTGHPTEGFSMDWSTTATGHLLTGDCQKYIYHWVPTNANLSSWNINKLPFIGHKGSVEDIQWSPNEKNVFASCSVDKSIRIWDIRNKNRTSMLNIDNCHQDDINVINWNRNVTYLLVSGCDDGSFKIWDLRHFKANEAIAHFRYHTSPITSIQWHPTDESVIAVAGADNQISIWDMSVEEDKEKVDTIDNNKIQDIPPQLLFIHQGQTDIKELRFHPQCPGVIMSTAADGYNVFKPANIS